jgi:hypothetical protein
MEQEHRVMIDWSKNENLLDLRRLPEGKLNWRVSEQGYVVL